MNYKRGIILGYEMNTQGLNRGDMVQRLDGFDNNFYTVHTVDHSNANPYFLKSKDNGELINFDRSELTKCHYSFFDYDAYFQRGARVFLGAVKFEDIIYVKAKKGNELELGYSELKDMGIEEILGMDFYGNLEDKIIIESSDPNLPVASVLTYFKIDRPT